MCVQIQAVLASCLLIVTSSVWAENEASEQKYPGEKVLVQFSRVDQSVEDAVTKAKLTVVEKIGTIGMVLDCGKEKPGAAVMALPNYQGAIIFRDGQFAEAIGYKTAKGKFMVPQSYACLRWGSTQNHMKQMEADIERCSKLVSVHSEKINLRPGERVLGNPWMLKLTPEKGTTLLEVFHLTGAKFDYVEGNAPK